MEHTNIFLENNFSEIYVFENRIVIINDSGVHITINYPYILNMPDELQRKPLDKDSKKNKQSISIYNYNQIANFIKQVLYHSCYVQDRFKVFNLYKIYNYLIYRVDIKNSYLFFTQENIIDFMKIINEKLNSLYCVRKNKGIFN